MAILELNIDALYAKLSCTHRHSSLYLKQECADLDIHHFLAFEISLCYASCRAPSRRASRTVQSPATVSSRYCSCYSTGCVFCRAKMRLASGGAASSPVLRLFGALLPCAFLGGVSFAAGSRADPAKPIHTCM